MTRVLSRHGLGIWCGLACWAVAWAGGPVRAGVPIYEPLRRAESEHFIFICQVSLEPLLPELVRDCEEAQAVLSPVFRWTPGRKTVVFFLDHVDVHNGSATVYPRPKVFLYAAAPPPNSTVYEPGPYWRRTLFHEYAHILTLDAQYGPGRALARVFGRVLPGGDPLSILLAAFTTSPTSYGPDWFVEGVATWSETEYVGQGRGRTSYSDMVFRLAALEGRTLDASQWILGFPAWPYGRAPYLYGMRAMQAAQAGASEARTIPGELVAESARAWPYLFGDQAIRVTGSPLRGLGPQARALEEAFQAGRVAALRSMPLTDAPRLTPPGLEIERPVFAPDGRSVYVIGHREGERDAVRAVDLDSGGVRTVADARVEYGMGSRLAGPTKDGRLFYTRLDMVGRDRLWNHLLALDLADDSVASLACRGRYHFPAVRADGLRLAAVCYDRGGQRLVELPLASAGERERERLLARAEPGHMLLDPDYSPDGRGLVYVDSGPAGSALCRIDLTTGRNDRLLAWPCVVAGPVYHPSGQAVVFSADANGVYNLYRLDLSRPGAPAPLTHVLGGLFEPAFSPDGRRLAAVGYDSRGPYLTVLGYPAPAPGTGAAGGAAPSLPVIRPVWNTLPGTRAALDALGRTPAPPVPVTAPYRSWAEVGLDYWTPWLTYGDNDLEGGLASSFSDPAERQAVSVMAGAESRFQTLEGSASYRYGGWYAIPRLFGASRPRSYPGLLTDTHGRRFDYHERAGTVGAAATLPWLTVDRTLNLTLGYRYTDVRELTESGQADWRALTLATAAPYEGGEGAVFAELSLDTTTAFRQSCSREDGRLVRLTVERGDSLLGGGMNRTRALGVWREYISLPWGRNHVLALAADGGAGGGDAPAQGAFGLGGFGNTVEAGQPGLDRRVTLRGYRENEQVGDQVLKAGLAYRFPIWRLYRAAHDSSPLVFHQVFGEAFYDGGRTWGEEAAGSDGRSWIQSAGLEANCDLNLARWVRLAPGLGVAYAFDRTDTESKVRTSISLKAAAEF